jgi:hypothetical protein
VTTDATSRFEMTLDTANVVSSVLVLAVLFVPAIVVPFAVGPALSKLVGPTLFPLVALLLGGVPIVALALVAAWAPCGLEIAPDEVRVLRRLGAPKRVPLSSIASVEPGPTPQIRLMGAGGFLGSFGLFSSHGFGRFHLYATRRGNYVALRLKEGLPVVVTPDDEARFRDALRQRLSRATP